MNSKPLELLPNQVLESMPFGFLRVDNEGTITFANNSAFRLLELPENELIGSKYDSLRWDQLDEDQQPLEKGRHTIYQALQGKTITSALRIVKCEERLKWLSINTAPLHNAEGTLIGAISNFIEVTDTIQNEHKAKENQKWYDLFIDEAPYAITVYDKDGTLIRANNKCSEYLGAPVEPYVGHFNLLQADLSAQNELAQCVQRAFQANPGEVVSRLIIPQLLDSDRKFRIKFYPLLDHHGNLERVVFTGEDISLYAAAIEKTENEEKLKQEILDALVDGILVVDADGLIVSTNKSLLVYLKREKIQDSIIGNSIYSLIAELREHEFLKKSLNAILQGESSFFEYQLRLNNKKWYNLKINPLIGRKGAVVSFQNINTRKEIEMALEKSLKKYRNIYNKAPVMMHSVDQEGKIVSVSDFWLDKMGYDRNEIIGKTPKIFIAEEYHQALETNLEKLFKEGEVKNVFYDFVKKSGEVIHVVQGEVAEYDENGHFERSIAGMIDITDQKKIEQDLSESKEKLIEAQRISRIGNYELDLKTGDFISSNEMDLIIGWDGSNEKNITIIKELVHPEDHGEFMGKLDRSVKTKEDFFYIYRIYHLKSSKLKWISGRGKIVSNAAGDAIKMIGTIQDITEQRAAEDKIKKLSDRILLSTEIANLGVWEYDVEMDEVYWEDQMYVIFPDTVVPYRLEELQNIVAEDDEDFIDNKIALINKGINFLESEMKIRIDEETRYLRTFTRIIRYEDNRLKGLIGVVYDITEDKKLQKELERSLDEKNILIREVHHRVKNNMQLISSIMALKAYELKDESAKIIFEEINTRIKAMSVIYDRLHKFYNVSEIDISEYLTHISKELAVLLGIKKVQLNIEVIKEVMSIDHALILGLIVSELVSNAMKHGFEKDDTGEINVVLDRLGEDKICLKVTNTGVPIPEDTLSSTRGVGMSLIKTFTRQLNGELLLDDHNGFRVEF